MVLRIMHGMGARSRTTLKLEGSVVGEWAALLERECDRLLRSRDTVSLDLEGVTFVDRAGVEALDRLSRVGVEIHCSGLVASVLEGEGIHVVRDAEARSNGQPDR